MKVFKKINHLIFYFTIAAVFCSACANSKTQTQSTKKVIDEKTAVKTAISWLEMQYPQRKDFDIREIKTTGADNNILSYNIEFENGGFVIVSADQNAKPVMAYSNTSFLYNSDKPVEKFIDKYVENMAKNNPESFDASANSIRKKSTRTTVEPMIQTHWSQSGGTYPNFTYNNAAPYVSENKRAPVGCAVVALAQVLKYYNYPKIGLGYNRYCSTGKSVYNCWDGEIIEASFSSRYQWDNMPESLNSLSSEESIDAVSTFLFHIGVSMNTVYGEKGSNAQLENPLVFRNFKKHFRMTDVKNVKRSDYSSQEWTEMIKKEIIQGRPVVLFGYDSQVDAGHAYIIDGINEHGNIHMNLGWGGYADGYYNLNYLVILNKYEFTEDLIAIVNFTPNVIEENGTCNGPEGLRCKDGFVCAVNDAIVDESTSDEYGTCMNEDEFEHEPVIKTIEKKYSGTVAAREWKHYGPFDTIDDINIVMTGTADADLYVRKRKQPDMYRYDCRPFRYGSNETCTLSGRGEFYVSVNGWDDSSDYAITVTYLVEE